MNYITVRSLPALFLFAIALAGLGSCGRSRGKGGTPVVAAGTKPVEGDWVVIHSLADPESLNPLISSDAIASEIDGYIYESLTVLNPLTLERVPWIADSLPTIGDDHLSYEFTLKKNVTFSDGHPVTGADFIFYLKTLKNQKITNAAPTRGYYERVDSAILVDGDPYRLRIIFNKPYFLGASIVGDMIALPKHIWDPENLTDQISFAALNNVDTAFNDPLINRTADSFQMVQKGMDGRFLTGSGPYRFSEWERNQYVALRRNDHYWNKGEPLAAAYPEKLMWSSINDFNAALVSLRGGDLDVMPRMEKVQYSRVRDLLPSLGLKPVEYDYPAYNYIGYNQLRPIFRDRQVRKALAFAINREAIVSKIYFGAARAIQSPIFYQRPEYDTTLPIIKYNLDSARKMLADAGWADSDGDGVLDKVIDGKKTDLVFSILLNSGNQARQQMGILFVNELKKIGVSAKTISLDWATFLDYKKKRDFDAYIGGWAMEVTEGDMYQIWHSKSAEDGGSNDISFKNKRVDDIIEQTRGEFDMAKRLELSREMQKIINDEQPCNFLVSERFTGAYSDRFQSAKFYAPRPCYNAGWWWAPQGYQRYGNSTKAVALN